MACADICGKLGLELLDLGAQNEYAVPENSRDGLFDF
jgi:hypothetical protein